MAFNGTGSNVTSLNASNVASGTLAVGHGGTGITSAGTSGNVLTSNGSAWVSSAPTSSITGERGQVFTSSGTFTIPTGITSVKVTVVGGGGNSGAANTGNYRFGMGGGGGGAAIKYLNNLTSGNTLAVTVGGAGGTSSVASGTQSITTISGTGGGTGTTNALESTAPTLGGNGINGDINISGGSSNSPATADDIAFMSAGGNSIFGSSQGFNNTGYTSNKAGTAAINYGCGGSGPYRYDGSNSATAGFQGIVIFEW